jgi:alginate O-acetyltransferase complex protein AlgI
MLFNSTIFLFLFLPIVLALSFAAPKKMKNFVLLVASLIFYAWGGVSMTIIILISILFNYFIGRLIEKNKTKPRARYFLVIGLVLNLGVLATFKYLNFLVFNINHLFTTLHFTPLHQTSIALPIGISFFTFHSISYITDVYRNRVTAQNNIINHSLYITLFPQLIAGPIVRYSDISEQIKERTVTFEKFSSGVERFIIGLAKKMLIANTFASVADDIFSQNPGELTTYVAWLGILAYTIQIYYDFSGYSDMAIGLGRMFGFEFLENFNFPYIATSIQDFWRRWHISLSNWFRDYLYISLGGNRCSKHRVLLNLFIVFLCTGFWHGASWNFIVWGLFHGLFIILEKAGFDKILLRLWKPIRHIYVLFVVIIAWVFFRSPDIHFAFIYLKKLFGMAENAHQWTKLLFYFNNEFIICFAFAIIGGAGIFQIVYSNTITKVVSKQSAVPLKVLYDGISVVVLMGMFILSIVYFTIGSYSPFIYFRF